MAEEISNLLLVNGPDREVVRFIDLSVKWRSGDDRDLFDFSAGSAVPDEFTTDLAAYQEKYGSIHGAFDRGDFRQWREENWGTPSIFADLFDCDHDLKGVASLHFITDYSAADKWLRGAPEAFPSLLFELSYDGGDGDSKLYTTRSGGVAGRRPFEGFTVYTKGLNTRPTQQAWERMSKRAASISGYELEWNWFFDYLGKADADTQAFARDMDENFAEVDADEIKGEVDHDELETHMTLIRGMLLQDVVALRREFSRAKSVVIRRGKRRETSHLLGWAANGQPANADIGDIVHRLRAGVLQAGGLS